MRCFVRFFYYRGNEEKKASPDFYIGSILFPLMACKNMSNWLQMGKCSKKNPTNFSAFAERIFQKAIFLKNETTKTLLRTVKPLYWNQKKPQPSRTKPVYPGCVLNRIL